VSGRRIAVIGAGVSGLTAAHVLARTNEVTLLERQRRLGGHAHTHRILSGQGQWLALDTGFIVYNERTYPLLTRLLAELGVRSQPSEMSMSVHCRGCGLEYAGQRGAGGILAGLVSGGGRRYPRLLAQILRFHRAARGLLEHDDGSEPTLGAFLSRAGFSAHFLSHFAIPFVAAVWSCAPGTALNYPARYLFSFLDNHGLLSVSGSPQWRTVAGGSGSYVTEVAGRLHAVRAGAPIVSVRRFPGGAEVRDEAGLVTCYDAVVVATHPDEALAMLADPSPAERSVLGAFRYSRNSVQLHTDAEALPARRRVRASWNYQLRSCRAPEQSAQVSYYLNRLQRLDAAEDYVVTLNGADLVRPDRVLATMMYRHPVYDPVSVAAQRRLPELNDGVTAFAGAYHGWGFHEDGCRSGVAAARSLGGRW
jgi:predicted NAD/FAD-binding protein